MANIDFRFSSIIFYETIGEDKWILSEEKKKRAYFLISKKVKNGQALTSISIFPRWCLKLVGLSTLCRFSYIFCRWTLNNVKIFDLLGSSKIFKLLNRRMRLWSDLILRWILKTSLKKSCWKQKYFKYFFLLFHFVYCSQKLS